jgi:hypothetical protein
MAIRRPLYIQSHSSIKNKLHQIARNVEFVVHHANRCSLVTDNESRPFAVISCCFRSTFESLATYRSLLLQKNPVTQMVNLKKYRIYWTHDEFFDQYKCYMKFASFVYFCYSHTCGKFTTSTERDCDYIESSGCLSATMAIHFLHFTCIIS